MKKALSLLLALVLCLGLCACGGNDSPIVGTWHTYTAGTTCTYTFKANGTYTVEIEGYVETEEKGKYAFNEEDKTVTFKTNSGETTHSLSVHECVMYLDDVMLGRVYSNNEKCDALDTVLGKWVYASYGGTTSGGTYLEFNKDGTYSLTTQNETNMGIYIYDPVEKLVELPDADLLFAYVEASDGTFLRAINAPGLEFKR